MNLSRRGFLGFTAALAPIHQLATREAPEPRPRRAGTMYLGTYGPGVGIATYDVDGRITATGTIADVPNPSFVIRSGNLLYAVNEQDAGAVTAIDISGTPKVLNRQPTKGSGPCHLAKIGNQLVTANYGSGDVSVHPINADGSLGQPTELVKHEGSAPHAHQIVQAGEYVLAVDLGTDSIYSYTLAGGKLALKHQAKLATGAGPRHLVYYPSGKYTYVADELNSTVTICGYDAGVFTVLKSIPVASGKNYPGEIVISADGRFVYVTNRGHNSVSIFRTVRGGAELELVGIPGCGGDWPRHCAFDPAGRLLFVANQKSNNVATFLVDQTTGGLTQTSDFGTPSPVCVAGW
ncbi:lactonase family protein [Kribbella solani]|uniref:lactonase family protein n=1 Tax=Kribbella solani TaxID=236067 RepID=UPI0029B59C51|nr:lactonase family protein [Kribbella solani]MDX3003296.1 lactonase family protein [Kribbella solani]